MRTFITKTAGATFLGTYPYTFNVRKDAIEFIFKMNKRGWYMVVNLCMGEDGWFLMTDWGEFFRRILNHKEPEKLMAMLKRPCPKLFQLFTDSTSKYAMGYSPDESGTMITAPVPEHLKNVLFSQMLGSEEVLDSAEELAMYSLNLFYEIREQAPFPAWKEGINQFRRQNHIVR